jgi:chromate reductase, NAD(P)H dehydrogenase (quinone)
MNTPLTILPILGSLRTGSLNRLVVDAARELTPPGATLLPIPDLRPIPPFDEERRLTDGYPESVLSLREAIRESDAVLFVSPEYNYSLPGFLKNAIDWASRGDDQPFRGKPVGIMGASGGQTGTARMQYHLRQVLVFLDCHPLNRPEIMISAAPSRFDDAGRLVDERTASAIARYLERLRDWTIHLGAA